jgi:hypothetical protein
MFSKIAEEIEIKNTELFHIEAALNNLELIKICQARLSDNLSFVDTSRMVIELKNRRAVLREQIAEQVA